MAPRRGLNRWPSQPQPARPAAAPPPLPAHGRRRPLPARLGGRAVRRRPRGGAPPGAVPSLCRRGRQSGGRAPPRPRGPPTVATTPTRAARPRCRATCNPASRTLRGAEASDGGHAVCSVLMRRDACVSCVCGLHKWRVANRNAVPLCWSSSSLPVKKKCMSLPESVYTAVTGSRPSWAHASSSPPKARTSAKKMRRRASASELATACAAALVARMTASTGRPARAATAPAATPAASSAASGASGAPAPAAAAPAAGEGSVRQSDDYTLTPCGAAHPRAGS